MYLYETHLHTNQGSACGNSQGHEYIRRYRDLGYTGIFVTDHFVRGNCVVDRAKNWPEFVKRFCEGYEDAYNEGLKINFPVFFGWEETFDGDDFLVYGFDKEWLIKHPEVQHWSRKEQYEQTLLHGGCVVQAHPFRERGYISTVHLSPWLCDALEVVNCGNTPQQDLSALRFAQKHGLRMTGGSDIHSVTQMAPGQLSGVAFAQPLGSIFDYARALRGERDYTLVVPADRTSDGVPEMPVLPLDLRDADDRSIPVPHPLF